MPRLASLRRPLVFAILALSLAATGILLAQRPARAWWSGGHKACTAAAVKMLPDDMPEFFRNATDELCEMCVEPDEWKSATAPRLKASEAPEHFIDLEHFEGKPLPRHRFDALKHYASKNIDMAKGGTLPYALEEGYERLALAFRQVRIYPESAGAKHRAIVYAGWLAHYCGDLAMPLHSTVNYDGKPGANGTVIQKGIHARLDSYPEKNGFTPEMLAEKQKAGRRRSIWILIEETINESHTHVEKCYELDEAGGFDKEPEKAKEFVLARARLGAKLTADLWYTAWEKSDPGKATIK
ncbi:MAG: S1/P1 nuclease [Planctomycetota bacterium]